MSLISRSGKAGFASAVGTTVEWYDFFIYGTAAGLVFNKLFFPQFDAVIGTLLSFATFSAAFVARPIGGVLFGHFGDRIGRKSVLVLTLSIMGTTTFAVGVLPSYGTIGVAAPVILVTLRFVQGLSLGGEYGGAVLMAVEHAPSHRRGYYGSWVQMGVPAGLMLGNAVFLAFGAMSPESFLSWGWRVPFLIGGVFVLAGLAVRLKLGESPSFDRLKDKENVVKLPIAVVLRQYPKQVLLTGGAYLSIGVTFYLTTVFGLSYGAQQVGFSRNSMLWIVLAAMALTFVTLPVFGALSDRFGRKPVFAAGTVAMGVLAFPWFWLLGTGSFLLAALGYLLICTGFSAAFGPLAAFFAEAFETKIRYSGISFGYTLGTLASSALAPIVATWLLDRTGGVTAVAWYMVCTAVLSLLCTFALRETYGSKLPDQTRTASRSKPPLLPTE
ncbi:MHS family MFS transporter [Amycolatopsis acidiphila]|uniref:Putative proline/betaine transporter n=2 Tax=Amycolatopsis acidiphila TaxID=715473 RepID=A0A558AM89_9PSEU|nr:MFS transporter [Amycolatopsis acidiphila]TVT25376.1 MHS family MFS transporter [Amycolatopsis acidiphila]UIJ62509.1 MHS family MFS transporter [Amycolatopsis acidiphila]